MRRGDGRGPGLVSGDDDDDGDDNDDDDDDDDDDDNVRETAGARW